MTADPPVNRDGTCAQCGGKRPTVTSTMRKYAGPQIEADPFCSSTCARKWHGVPIESPPVSSHRPPIRISINASVKRAEYRMKNRVPCEDCGKLVEGKGRGGNPDRPYLCAPCYHHRQRKRAAA